MKTRTQRKGATRAQRLASPVAVSPDQKSKGKGRAKKKASKKKAGKKKTGKK